MLTEVKILFDNIKNIRHLLTEGVGQDAIKKAIEQHEWIYIYYEADNEEGKNAGGYRTVRPYVLGKNKSGNIVLRGWQDNPKNSWHFNHRSTRTDSNQHDSWSDREGIKPGWRMFRLDRITKVYPIGKTFNDSNGLPMIPPGYREGGDEDIVDIYASVSTKTEPDFEMQYDKDQKIDVVSKAERDKEKWDSIRRGNMNKRKITADDVVKLRDVASRVQKTAHGKYLVVIDDKNDFQLMLAKDKDKQNIPDHAIVGSLPYLYDSLVKKNAPSDDKFFNDMKNKTQTDLRMKAQNYENQPEPEINEEIPQIPHKKTTFFK